MKYLICIPTYNESENLKKIIPAISNLKLKNTDILVIDDNSPDGTSSLAKKMNQSKKYFNKIMVMDRKLKQGLGKAYSAGFKWALKNGYNYIISMDADYSHDPKYLPKIIEESKKFDVVIGSRHVGNGRVEGWNWWRHVNSNGAIFATRLLLGLKTHDVTAGYKCYSKDFLSSVDLKNLVSGGYSFQVEMINLVEEGRFSIKEIPIVFVDRQIGESKISGELSRSAKAVFQLASKKKTYREFIKFGVVGFTGTLIDLGVYNILAVGFDYNEYSARTVSFVLAVINNYILNRVWTFRNKDKQVGLQFFKFLVVSVVGYLLNLGIMAFTMPMFNSIPSELAQKNIPVLIAIFIVLFWNYFANKLWTFKNNKTRENS